MDTVNTSITTHVKKHAPRQGLVLAAFAGFIWLFYDRITALDSAGIWAGFNAVLPYQWIGALLATGVSFWAVGRYDAVVHRMIGTGTNSKLAHRAGVAGIAVSQTLGMGVLTGALSRWRMLPDTSLWQATRISATVAISFLAGWTVVTSIAILLFSNDLSDFRWLAILPIGAAVLFSLASLRGRKLCVLGRQFSFPSLLVISSILMLTAIDTVAAASALYVLLPHTVTLSFSLFYTAFLLALGAALLSGSPGGVGPFEVTLLVLLPTAGTEPVLGAVLAFRLVYYALPAVIGALILARGPRTVASDAPKTIDPQTVDQDSIIRAAPFAEANLIRQGGKQIVSHPLRPNSIMVTQTAQALIALRDPLCRQQNGQYIRDLKAAAKNQARIPCLYKCSARAAVHARSAGLTVRPIAREAWIDPRVFSVDTPNHRQLRRKLRKSKTAEIVTTHANARLPLAEMAAISESWVARSGAERGFSMGVFTPQFVQSQRCYLATQNGALLGFMTFNTCDAEWSLDIMRQTADAPDGTMHALLVHALAEAAKLGVTRLSLAAIPFQQKNKFVQHCVQSASGSGGLRQFKSAFAPNWQTLYMAAPTPVQFCIAAFDVAREITKDPRGFARDS